MSTKSELPYYLRIDFFLLLILLVGGCLINNAQLLDTTLSSRFLFSFCTISVIYFISFKKILHYLETSFNYIDVLIGIFTLWQLLSILWATNTSEAIADSLKSVLFFSIYLYVKSLLLNSSEWKKQLYSIITITSFIYNAFLLLELYNIHLEVGLNGQNIYFLHYPSGGKNLISIALLMFLPFIYLTAKSVSGWKKSLIYLNVAFSLIFLFILSTRAVSFGIIASGIIFLLHYLIKKPISQKKWLFPILIISMGIAHYYFANFYRQVGYDSYKKKNELVDKKKEADKINHLKSGSKKERFVLWKKTMKLIQQEPLLGVGAGNWKIEFPRNGYNDLIRAEFFSTSFNRPHNEFLWILSEYGIIGFLLFLSILGIISFYHIKIQTGDVLIFIGFVAFWSSSLFDFPRERAEHTLLLAVYFAILSSPISFKNRLYIYKLPVYVLLAILNFAGATVFFYRNKGEVIYKQVRIAKNQGQYKQAIKGSKAAENFFYTTDILNFPIRWYHAISLIYLNDHKKAYPIFKNSLKENPYNFHTLNNIGSCLVYDKKFKEANRLFKQCLAINQHFEDARFNLSFSYCQLGEYDLARSILEINITNNERKKVFLKEIERLDKLP